MPSIEHLRQHFAGARSKELRGHKSKVHSVAWSCDGRKLASGSTDHTARIWIVERHGAGKDSIELKGHTSSVDQLAWSPVHPELLATASADKTVRIWDLAQQTGHPVSTINTAGENINIAWRGDGAKLAVGSKDDVISIIDVASASVEHKHAFAFEVNEFGWDPTDSSFARFFITTGAGNIDIVGVPDFGKIESLPAHTANCYCLAFDRQAKHMAAGSADAVVSLWDLASRTCFRTLSRLQWPIRSLSFSCDGEFVAAASEDTYIHIALKLTGENVARIPTTAPVNTLAWHPSKLLLAYAGDETDRAGRAEGNLRVFGLAP